MPSASEDASEDADGARREGERRRASHFEKTEWPSPQNAAASASPFPPLLESAEGLPLAERPSPVVDGLRVTSRLVLPGAPLPDGVEKTTAEQFPTATPLTQPAVRGRGSIVVGTIRMGFGHHRIAYAASSWAVHTGKPT